MVWRTLNEQAMRQCPECKLDLDGDLIWDTGYRLAGTGMDGGGPPAKTKDEREKRADEYASKYGATRTEGRWGREIVIITDGTFRCKCPACGHIW